jgi:hypothetical protein
MADYVELNRIDEGPFSCNHRGTIVAPQKTDAISLEIARIVSQVYASTFDTTANIGFAPQVIALNNGDFVIHKDSVRDDTTPPLLRMCVANQVMGTSPTTFVELLVGPRGVHPTTSKGMGSIISPTAQNLPLLVEAITAGFTPRFNGQAPEIAISLLREFAGEYSRRVHVIIGAMAEGVALLERGGDPDDFVALLSNARKREDCLHSISIDLLVSRMMNLFASGSASEQVLSAVIEEIVPSSLIRAIQEL